MATFNSIAHETSFASSRQLQVGHCWSVLISDNNLLFGQLTATVARLNSSKTFQRPTSNISERRLYIGLLTVQIKILGKRLWYVTNPKESKFLDLSVLERAQPNESFPVAPVWNIQRCPTSLFFRTLIIDTLMSVAERNWNCIRGVKTIVEFFKKISRDQMAMGWKLAKYKGKKTKIFGGGCARSGIRLLVGRNWQRWGSFESRDVPWRSFDPPKWKACGRSDETKEGNFAASNYSTTRQLAARIAFWFASSCFLFFQSWNHVTRWGGNSGLIDQLSRVLTKG